jgi:hypothetical protein
MASRRETLRRRQGSHPPDPSGGGASGSLTKGLREEHTFIVDNQQAGRVGQKGHNDPLEAWREQVNQARGGQEASWSLAQGLAQESAEAYEDYLERFANRMVPCKDVTHGHLLEGPQDQGGGRGGSGPPQKGDPRDIFHLPYDAQTLAEDDEQ